MPTSRVRPAMRRTPWRRWSSRSCGPAHAAPDHAGRQAGGKQKAPSPTGYGASAGGLLQREAAFFWMADLRLAAWFLWMTPLEAALSSCLPASTARALASSAPASAAARNLRTAVFSADLTALLRSCAASFCRLRLIWDLMFATSGSPLRCGVAVRGHPERVQTRRETISAALVAPKSARAQHY